MQRLERYELLQEAIKCLVRAERDVVKKSEKAQSMDYRNSTPKQVGAAQNRLTDACQQRDRGLAKVHALAVDAGVADVRDIEHYMPRSVTVGASGSHTHNLRFDTPVPEQVIEAVKQQQLNAEVDYYVGRYRKGQLTQSDLLEACTRSGEALREAFDRELEDWACQQQKQA